MKAWVYITQTNTKPGTLNIKLETYNIEQKNKYFYKQQSSSFLVYPKG